MDINMTCTELPVWRILVDGTTVGMLIEEQLNLLVDYLMDVPTLSWVKVIVITAIISLSIYYLVLPVNWVKDLSDVGFEHVTEKRSCSAQRKGKTKKEIVKEILHLRNAGNLPPVYPNGWFMLLESDDLGPSQVKHVAALGENFAVFRTSEGKVYILDAYCPHLGANMGIGGSVHGNCLECPFHSWRFSGEDGKCSSVPYSDKIPEVAKVKKWPSCEVNTFIFVWYHSEGEEPSWYPEPIKPIDERLWMFRGRSEFIINSHIQEIPENGGDVAHLAAVHGAALLNGSDLRACQSHLWNFMRHNWSAKWDPCTEPGKSHIANMLLTHELLLFNKISIAGLTGYINQIGPGYVELNLETSFFKMILLQTVTPVEPLLQKVVHRMYCPPMSYLYAGFALFAECVMIERDIMVWNHKTYIQKPILVKEDRNIARHRRWYSQFYTENSPRFTFQKNTLDW